MQNETPQEEIIPSAVVPGGILDVSNDPTIATPMGTMVQPKKGQDSLGGLYAGASEVSQGSGDDVFKISSKGIHLGAANFADAPFSVSMSGAIVATQLEINGTDFTSGSIAGMSITSTALTATAGGNQTILSSGATAFSAGPTGSPLFTVTQAGDATASSITITGGSVSGASIASIPNSTATDISLLGASYDLVFSVTDADTIAWASGTISLSNGRTFSISGGNTGNMAALTYIYLDPAVSSTVLQTTTTYSTANGANKKLIGTAQNHTVTASFIPFEGGQPLIDGANIGALSIVAGNIAATTITAGKLSVATLSAITADLGTITAGSISINGGVASISAAGVGTFSNIAISGATSTFNSSLVTNVQNRAETLWTKDYAFVGNKVDGLLTAVSGGTITRDFISTLFNVAGAGGQSASLYSDSLGRTIDGGAIGWGTGDFEFSASAEFDSNTAQDAFIGLFHDNSNPSLNATDVARHIGFYIEDGTTYVSNADGTTQKRTSISCTLTNMNFFSFVYDTGVDIRFYINDTLVVTHTENLPATSAGVDPSIFFWISNSTAVEKNMIIKNNYLVTLDI